ncbi:MAG: GGDEF domain-containing protein [Rhodoferax sp.]|nr:MAG: GGDEF domain-containing protein [Rhodoferax sp.]
MHTLALHQLLPRLLLLLAALLTWPAQASETALDVSQVSTQPLSLTTWVDLLEDPSAQLTLADVQSPTVAARFVGDQPAITAFALGFTRSSYWMRLTLHNPSDTAVRRMLDVDNPRISSVQLHWQDAQGNYQSLSTGCDTPFATRAYPNRGFVFPLTLPAHSEQVLYLRVSSNIGLLVPIQLWTEQAFHAHERNDYLVQAWYFGIASAMVLFNLMLFLALRDRIYLLYVVFVATTVFTLAVKNGIAVEFLGGSAWMGSNVAYYSGASLGLSALLLFMRSMLGTRKLLPRTDIVMQGVAVFYLLTPLVYALALPAVSQAAIVANLLSALFIAGVGLVCALRRQRSAYFFVGAFGMLMLGGAMTTLRAMGVVPTNEFTVDGMQLGSALEMLLLAFALADRYNSLRKAKAQAQQELLQVQEQLVKTLRNSEHELELRVAQRTEELLVLNNRLEALSLTDGLTGVANRRRFDTVLQQEWARAQRHGHPLALAMLDVDWFKQYNDHYGHPAGDECLSQIAHALQRSVCRTGDLVARYGGEEFVFIAPATDGCNALGMAQKVAQAVQALALPHAKSPLGHLSVSIGVAAWVPAPDSAPDALVEAADTALYQAKKQGRNQVVLHTHEDPESPH